MKRTELNEMSDSISGRGLDILHQESKDWLNIIAFWTDESRFFADLLDKKDRIHSERIEMLQYLDKVHKSLFHYLAEDIIAHEKHLSRLLKGKKGVTAGEYVEKHMDLREQIHLFTMDFKEFKKMVFDFAKK
ncbi:hypothetical protein [Arenibacter latericius]|uniref:hypothetical protein n=1 Tax=Arenibacter latericius TaxID=86104 RepID=UPI00041B9B73|nr:hypothetical protein [Arenibacter latericius]MDX1362883.1 hypothetical protein [Arenibacter latericius]